MIKYYLACATTKTKVAIGTGDEVKIRIVWSGNETAMRSFTAFCQLNAGKNVRLLREDHKSIAKLKEVTDAEPASGGSNATWAQPAFAGVPH